MKFPRMLLVKQHFPERKLKDIASTVARELGSGGIAQGLRPGSRIAIGAGSRGIKNITAIARAAVDFWKAQGMKPFIFPAMGSHGAATAEGQAAVLSHLGIREGTMGCPVISSLDVVPLTKTPEGIQTYMDRTAFESDGVMLLGRVKWHTSFDAKLESGLFKMMAIGMGKLAGAQMYHTHAYTLGLGNVVRAVGREVLKSGKIIGGLAIMEDAYHDTAQLTAVPAADMERREEELLAIVKSWRGKIPADLDILILDEIGKTISGAGMDTKVVNRGSLGEYNVWPDTPHIDRIFIRGLSAESHGNACGIGLADVVHNRLLRDIDEGPTYVNVLASGVLGSARIPIHFPTDRQCIETLLPSVGKLDTDDVRIGWIRNTLELSTIAFSENMRAEIERNPALEIVESGFDLPFDSAGDLESIFARGYAAVGSM